MRQSSQHQAGFIRGRLIQTILLLTGFFLLTHYGIQSAREYCKIQKCETCTARMWSIETAKKKYKAIYTTTSPDSWTDLLPFLPNKSIPECPWGGKYENVLNLKQRVTCSLNGNPKYEPKTPGISLTQNGYMDVAKPPQTVTIADFLLRKVPTRNTPKESTDELLKRLFSRDQAPPALPKPPVP